MGRRRKIVDPQTLEEWQDVADWSEFFVSIDSCRQYGLITGGPLVNVDRSLELLERAKAQGITPRPDAIERCARLWSEARLYGIKNRAAATEKRNR